MMQTPAFNYTAAAMYSRLIADKYLFNEDTQYLNKLKKYYDLKYGDYKEESTSRIDELEKELEPLLTDISKFIIRQTRNYTTVANKSKKFEAKKKELLEYTIATESRYHYFKEKEFEVNLPPKYSYSKFEILDSIKSNIEAVEGFAALSKSRNSETYFNQYQYSGEEIKSKRHEHLNQIHNLKTKAKESDSFADKKKIFKEIINAKIEKYEYEFEVWKHKVEKNIKESFENGTLEIGLFSIVLSMSIVNVNTKMTHKLVSNKLKQINGIPIKTIEESIIKNSIKNTVNKTAKNIIRYTI